jgi:MerR family mercuric resistance operon transcriptional regulator
VSGIRTNGVLTIGDLSRRTGVSVEAIRYYERLGLMPPPPRTQSGRRSFGPDELRTLAFIKSARQFDFSLDDVRKLLALRSADARCMEAKALANRHLGKVRAKLRHLEQLERMLAEAVGRCPGDASADCTVLQLIEDASRRVPARAA